MSDVDSSLLCHSAASRASLSFASAARRASAAAHASSIRANEALPVFAQGQGSFSGFGSAPTSSPSSAGTRERIVAEFGSVRLFRDASRRRPPPPAKRAPSSAPSSASSSSGTNQALEPVRVASSRRSLVDQSLGEQSLGERRERLGRRAPQKRRPLDERARDADSATRRFAENFWKKFSSSRSATPRLVRSYRNRRASRTCTVAAIVRASQTYRSRHARDGTTRAYAPTDSAATHSTYAAKISRVVSKTSRRRAKTSSRNAKTLSVPRVPPLSRGRLTRKDTESTPPPAYRVPAGRMPARRRRAASTAARPTWPPACGDTPRSARRRLPEAPREAGRRGDARREERARRRERRADARERFWDVRRVPRVRHPDFYQHLCLFLDGFEPAHRTRGGGGDAARRARAP